MRLLFSSSLLLLIVLTCLPAAARAQDRAVRESAVSNRIALLIGNANYEQKARGDNYKPFRVLRNPCNDVKRIAAILEGEGWVPDKEIIQICDARRSNIRDAIDQFKDAYLSADASLGFVYYAGHGLQHSNDTYLFGIDSAIDFVKSGVAAQNHPGGNIFVGGVRLFGDLISQVGDAGSGSIFIVMDACRETPIDRMARVDGYLNVRKEYPRPAFGIKLLYSAAYGELASDGLGSGSPFALSFEEHLKKEGRIDPLVNSVIRGVRDQTRNSALPQMPDTTGALNRPPPVGCLTTICTDSK